MKYGLFLYYTDESATCLNTPVLLCDTVPTEITKPMMVEIVRGLATEECHADVNFDAMDMQELADYVVNNLYLTMNRAAIIEEREFDVIEQVGDALMETMENDSSCYRAASVFSDVLHKKAVDTIQFPEGDYS